MKEKLESWYTNLWADSDNGSTSVLHSESWGSIPHLSTKYLGEMIMADQKTNKVLEVKPPKPVITDMINGKPIDGRYQEVKSNSEAPNPSG